MCGGPIEAVKEATKLVAEMNQERKVFKELFMIPFDEECKLIKFDNKV